MKSSAPRCIWLTGLSGSGKSTIASALKVILQNKGLRVKILDGDILRTGLNSDLGFSDTDRAENIRRAASVARLFLDEGFWVISAFITPTEILRKSARNIVGSEHYTEIYVEASYATCQKRDPKGLYKKVAEGKLKNFTGRDSDFDPPLSADLVANTENYTLEESMREIRVFVETLI